MNEIIRRIFNIVLTLSVFFLAIIVLVNGLDKYSSYKQIKEDYQAQKAQERKDAAFNAQQQKYTQELTKMTEVIIQNNNPNGMEFTQETLKVMQDDNITDEEMNYLRKLHHEIITKSSPASSPTPP